MKITLNPLGSFTNESSGLAVFNNNIAVIQSAFDNTLSRDGTAPNTMNSLIDMNSHQIINLPSPDTNTSPLRLQDLASFLGTGTIVVGQTSVSSIAQLTALPVGNYTAVNVLGYTTAGDGGGGLFYYSPTSVVSGDGGTVVTPNVGVGKWFRIFDLNHVTPKMFGAFGGTNNDTAFIQTAINVISNLGGGTLWLDQMYTIGGSVNANGLSLINLLSGVNIDGPGGLFLANNTNTVAAVFTATCSGTTMTVSSMASGSIATNQFINGTGFSAASKVVTQLGGTPQGAGTYQLNVASTVASGVTVHSCNRMVEMIGSYSPATVSNTSYKNFKLDYNGQNNCASQTIWSFNSVATINNGSNIVFDGVRFRNNCGSNSICLGIEQITPTLSDATIVNCSFQNDGDRINAASLDYSTIFAICSGLDVSDNTFTLGPQVNGAAFEVYGVDLNITDNRVHGYYNTANIVAISGQTTSNVNFTGNQLDVGNGLTLWTRDTTSKLRGINVVGNSFDITVFAAGGPYFVNAFSQVTSGSEIDNLNIVGNTYQNLFNIDSTRTSPGISVKSCQALKISGNTIYGVPGQGILISSSLDPTSIDITNNSLINVGYTATSASKVGIQLTASGTTGTLLIQGNVINPISGFTLVSGINNALGVTTGLIQNNLITGATTAFVNTGSGVLAPSNPIDSGVVVTTTASQTLTNKTLTSPTLTTPALGTPTAVVLTSATGLPLSTGVTGTLSNANLANSGALIIGSTSVALGATASTVAGLTLTAPVLTTPALGTPSSGTLSNCSSLPISGVTGLQTSGSWTPTDASGVGLFFSAVNCHYTQIGNMVHAYGTFTFPTTSSAVNALIGGLPVGVPNAAYAQVPGAVSCSTGSVAGIVTRTVINSSTFQFYNNNAGGPITNILLTGAVLTVNLTYPAT